MTVRRSTYVALSALLAVAPAACSDLFGPTDEPMDQLLFVSTRGGDTSTVAPLTDIYRMNSDGSGVENISQYPTSYGSLEISPDGRTVIFGATRPRLVSWTNNTCPDQIWTMAPDGSQMKQVTRPPGCYSNPRLSPDGTRFAYQRGDDIYVANIDGTEPRIVSNSVPPVTSSCSATGPPRYHVMLVGWASLSRPMFYRYICGVGYTYYSVDAQGNGLATLNFNIQTAYLSPDWTQIAFNRSGGVVVMNVDGSGERTLVQGSLPSRFSLHRSPWSPDGKRIYFITSEGHHIANVNAATDVRRLPDPPFPGEFNGWSPRGDRIAFTLYNRISQTEYTRVLDIYVMNVDGSGGANLTNSSFWNRNALWVPRR